MMAEDQFLVIGNDGRHDDLLFLEFLNSLFIESLRDDIRKGRDIDAGGRLVMMPFLEITINFLIAKAKL